MTDKLSDYGWGFQVKVLAAMFTDRLFLQQISDIIRAEYFESDANSWLLDIILTHFREYKTPPSKDVLKVKITEIENDILKATVLEQLKDVFRYMESDDLTFVKDEILKFCKNQEIKQAIMDSVSLLKHGNFDEIKTKIDSAMKAGADTNIGLEYVTDVAARYNEAARHTITTGWDVIDDLMDGGLAIENKCGFGVVILAKTFVKSAPSSDAADIFVLHEGTEVKILDRVDGFAKIRIADGQVGWTEMDAVASI